MVSARTDDDFSFVLSSWNEGIRPYDFALNVGGKWNTAIYHTRARSAAVPRRRNGVDEALPAPSQRRRRRGAPDLPGQRSIRITHLGSQTPVRDDRVVRRRRHRGNDVGNSEGSQARRLLDRSRRARTPPGTTAAASKSNNSACRRCAQRSTVRQRPQLRPAEVALDLHASYLSGGGASGLPVKLRTTIEPRTIQFRRLRGLPVRRDRRQRRRYPDPARMRTTSKPTRPNEVVKARVFPLNLDAPGAARVTVPEIPKIDQPSCSMPKWTTRTPTAKF